MVYVAPMKALAAEVTGAFSRRLGPLGRFALLLSKPLFGISTRPELFRIGVKQTLASPHSYPLDGRQFTNTRVLSSTFA